MVISSIDLMEGRAVQLVQGNRKVLERENPLELAKDFSRFGEIAVIDLDAALGKGENTRLIQELCRTAKCRVGGGIRTVEKASSLIANGAEKIIIGTSAFNDNGLNEPFLKNLADQIGKEKIIIAIDSRNEKIVIKGWQESTALNVYEIAQQAEAFCGEFLFTCVENEGMMQGANTKAIKKILQVTSVPVTVAGGISSLKEIKALAALEVNMQLGMSIYTGEFTMGEAFIASLKWNQELLPAIAQDSSGQILMQAFVNQESLINTFSTGKVWYYSRSRDALWMKGETSGHFQHFIKVQQDCDGDTVLFTVEQEAVACHKGSYSCFGARTFSLDQLQKVIQSRLKDGSKSSYTASLTDKTVREKILEEAEELVEANSRDHIIWEAADVIYFTLVLLAREDIQLPDVIKELERRRRIPEKR